MKASRVKAEAICWLRYGKKLPIVCTEVGNWNADVFGVSRTQSVEVETKVSRADIKAEFRNKKQKHFLYLNADGRLRSVPNYLYFMVPPELHDAALEIIPVENPKAGIAIFTDEGLFDGRNVRVIRPPQKLHDAKPSPQLIRTAILRMSSELCGLWLTNGRLTAHVEGELKRMTDDATLAAFRVAGNLDPEDPGASLSLRGAELAKAVDGLEWKDLDDAGRQRWREAAQRLLDMGEPAEAWADAKILL